MRNIGMWEWSGVVYSGEVLNGGNSLGQQSKPTKPMKTNSHTMIHTYVQQKYIPRTSVSLVAFNLWDSKPKPKTKNQITPNAIALSPCLVSLVFVSLLLFFFFFCVFVFFQDLTLRCTAKIREHDMFSRLLADLNKSMVLGLAAELGDAGLDDDQLGEYR